MALSRSRPYLASVLCGMVNVIVSSAKALDETTSHARPKGAKMFKFYFDEFNVEYEAEVPAEEPVKDEAPAAEPKESLTDAEFGALSEAEQNDFFAKSIDRNFAKAEGKEEPPAEEEEVEDPAAELEKEDAENESEEEVTEESTDEPVTEKRLKDTQHAFRAARSENAELKKRLEDLEKKVAAPAAPAKIEPTELTLATIKPEVLQKALQENPVNTMRWIADQQVKQSLEATRKANEQAASEVEAANFVKASEDAAIEKFPVLKEIIGLKPEALEKLKETSKVKYEFGQKTAKYYKEFTARGDKEAFYNAAARAYVELSPQMIKDVQIETKRLAEQESANKKRVLGKVSVSGNHGTINQKGSPKHKSLSEDEFMKLTPAQQLGHWDSSIDSKSAKRIR